MVLNIIKCSLIELDATAKPCNANTHVCLATTEEAAPNVIALYGDVKYKWKGQGGGALRRVGNGGFMEGGRRSQLRAYARATI